MGDGDNASCRTGWGSLGVDGVLLGNKPNCARGVCSDCADADRGMALVREANELSDTDEYAESFPVSGGLCILPLPFAVSIWPGVEREAGCDGAEDDRLSSCWSGLDSVCDGTCRKDILSVGMSTGESPEWSGFWW